MKHAPLSIALLALPFAIAAESISGPGWHASFHQTATVAGNGWQIGLSFVGARPVAPERAADRVRYQNLYEGVHAEFYRNGPDLEYDFIVEPGADPARIAVRFPQAHAVELTPNGALAIRTDGVEIAQHPPVTYQWREGRRHTVASAYRLLSNGAVGFDIGSYDRSLPLVIDPVITLSRLGGTPEFENTLNAARDSAGNLYLVHEGRRLRKINSTGSEIFLRTLPNDFGAADIAVDSASNIYLTALEPVCPAGTTNTIGGSGSAFVVRKLSPDGQTIVYQTCLRAGGGNAASGVHIAVDSAGNAYFTGSSNSPSFPASGNFGDLFADRLHLFVAKLDPSGNLLYSAVTGNDTQPRAIFADPAGSAYVAGSTSSDFQPRQALQAQFGGGSTDAFVLKITPNGDNIPFATFLGGSASDRARGIAVDASGDIVVSGSTLSANFPTAGQFARTGPGSDDVFVARLVPNGLSFSFAYSTVFGGTGLDSVQSLSIRPSGEALVTGGTASTDFLTVQPTRSAAAPHFATALSPDGEILFSTYVGGSASSTNRASHPFHTSNGFTLVGTTRESDFPRTSGPSLTGGSDWYLQIYQDPADLDLRLSGTGGSRTALVRNFGPGTATSVSLIISGFGLAESDSRCTAQLTVINCNLGTLTAGASRTVQFGASGTVGGVVISGAPDPNTGNNTDQDQ